MDEPNEGHGFFIIALSDFQNLIRYLGSSLKDFGASFIHAKHPLSYC